MLITEERLHERYHKDMSANRMQVRLAKLTRHGMILYCVSELASLAQLHQIMGKVRFLPTGPKIQSNIAYKQKAFKIIANNALFTRI